MTYVEDMARARADQEEAEQMLAEAKARIVELEATRICEVARCEEQRTTETWCEQHRLGWGVNDRSKALRRLYHAVYEAAPDEALAMGSTELRNEAERLERLARRFDSAIAARNNAGECAA